MALWRPRIVQLLHKQARRSARLAGAPLALHPSPPVDSPGRAMQRGQQVRGKGERTGRLLEYRGTYQEAPQRQQPVRRPGLEHFVVGRNQAVVSTCRAMKKQGGPKGLSGYRRTKRARGNT
jgi:hypothetical protein